MGLSKTTITRWADCSQYLDIIVGSPSLIDVKWYDILLQAVLLYIKPPNILWDGLARHLGRVAEHLVQGEGVLGQ